MVTFPRFLCILTIFRSVQAGHQWVSKSQLCTDNPQFCHEPPDFARSWNVTDCVSMGLQEVCSGIGVTVTYDKALASFEDMSYWNDVTAAIMTVRSRSEGTRLSVLDVVGTPTGRQLRSKDRVRTVEWRSALLTDLSTLPMVFYFQHQDGGANVRNCTGTSDLSCPWINDISECVSTQNCQCAFWKNAGSDRAACNVKWVRNNYNQEPDSYVTLISYHHSAEGHNPVVFMPDLCQTAPGNTATVVSIDGETGYVLSAAAEGKVTFSC